MTDILKLNERVRNEIEVGESDFREFKSALEGRPGNKKPRIAKKICEDIAEALVAFANTDGGVLIIGIEDDGTITGVPHSDKEIEVMLESTKTHIMDGQFLPLVYSIKLVIDNNVILFFQVEKGTNEIYQLTDGRVVIRQGKHTVPEKVKRLQFKHQEIMSREYDRQYVDGATVNDLDFSLIQPFADSFLKGMTVEKYLQQVKLAEYLLSGLKISRAALLLFAKDIQKWCPNSKVRFIKVSGIELGSGDKYNVISDEPIVEGNICELLLKSWEALRPFLAYKTVFGTGAMFEPQYIYPENACREALINAIAHRDYVSHNGVEVYIYDDRMEIKSPGALLSTITIPDLLALENRHESRNAKITYILKVNNYMREMGEGIKRIFNLMEEKELEKPKLYSNTVWFTVSLFNKSVYSEKQLEFLKPFDQYKLSVNQKKIVLLGINGNKFSKNDIFKAINTKSWADPAIKYLQKTKILMKEEKKEIVDTKLPNSQDRALYRTIRMMEHAKKDEIAFYKIVMP